jgi:S1-C subfamily serine protease
MRHAWLLALALAGCAEAAAPEPVVLSYPGLVRGSLLFDGARRLAEQVSGVYVRVLVCGATEDEGMPGSAVVSGASGAIVDPRGYIVTSAHVARQTGFAARITTLDGAVRPGRIVHVDPGRELALLKIAPFAGMQSAAIADSRRLRAGQPVLAIGTPDNRKGVVSPGRVTDPRRRERIEFGEFGFDHAIELHMEVEPGHSGGPLFDAEGGLVGIIAGFGLGDTGRVPYVPTRVAYAVPSAEFADYLAEVIGAQAPYRPASQESRPSPSALLNGL